MAAEGADGSNLSNGDGNDGPADGRGSLDVPEWVSELRRLYVEPKTRAKLRQEGAITPQKRRRGLTGGRGSRREDAPATPAPGATGPAVGDAATAGTPFVPEAVRPAPLEPANNVPAAVPVASAAAPTEPLVDESGAPYSPPGASVEAEVATWLTSYLVATGHAGVDEAPDPEPTEPVPEATSGIPAEATSRIPTEATADTAPEVAAGIPTETTAHMPAAAATHMPAEAAAHMPAEAAVGVSPEPAIGVRVAEAVPVAVEAAPEVAEQLHAADDHSESQPRSLAELAGLSAPDAASEPKRAPAAPAPAFVTAQVEPGSPAEPAETASPEPSHAPVPSGVPAASTAAAVSAEVGHSEPWRAAHEGAGVLVSTGGDAATPNPAVTTTPEREGSPSPDVLDPASGVGGSDGVIAHSPPPDGPAEGTLEEPPAEQAAVPGRPSTVPAVTLSWREAQSFEIGVPDVEDSEGSIVVEPPSQLVAARRGRRRELDADADDVEESVAADRVPAPMPPEEAPATRASTRAASGYRSGKRRRALIVGLVLLLLAIVAWYFLIRGNGDQASGGSTAPIGQSHSIVALSPVVSR
jgi:hypothetical protein